MPYSVVSVRGKRVTRRRDTRITRELLQRESTASADFLPYWAAFRAWVYRHEYNDASFIRVKTRLVTSDYCDPQRGRLIMLQLTVIESNRTEWFPTYDEVSGKDRNRLHVSICFDKDVQWLSPTDAALWHTYRAELEGEWERDDFRTWVTEHHRSGSFYLKGLNDPRMTWMHERGSYKKKPFGHIALYWGGL
jgi:hypothetical protein